MKVLSQITGMLSTGFFITTIFFVLGFLFLKSKREQLRGLIESAHIVFLVASTVSVAFHLIYITGLVYTWIKEDEFGDYAFLNRATGPYWWSYWWMIFRPFFPMILWWKKARRSIGVAVLMIFFAITPYLFERFVILVTTWHRDYLPSSWTLLRPSALEIGITFIVYGAALAAVHILRKRRLHG